MALQIRVLKLLVAVLEGGVNISEQAIIIGMDMVVYIQIATDLYHCDTDVTNKQCSISLNN